MRHVWVRSVARAGLTIVFVLAAVRGASAQNLVVNPHFDTDLSSWNFDAGTSVFDPTRDANGSASSGSGELTISPPTLLLPLHQCVTGVTAGTTYNFGAKVFIQQAPAGGTAGVGVAFFTNTTCASGAFGGAVGSAVSATNVWSDSTGSVVAPAGAVAAIVQTGANNPGPPTAFTVNFDDVFFQASAGVPTMPAPMLAVLAVGLAFLAYRALRRRSARA